MVAKEVDLVRELYANGILGESWSFLEKKQKLKRKILFPEINPRVKFVPASEEFTVEVEKLGKLMERYRENTDESSGNSSEDENESVEDESSDDTSNVDWDSSQHETSDAGPSDHNSVEEYPPRKHPRLDSKATGHEESHSESESESENELNISFENHWTDEEQQMAAGMPSMAFLMHNLYVRHPDEKFTDELKQEWKSNNKAVVCLRSQLDMLMEQRRALMSYKLLTKQKSVYYDIKYVELLKKNRSQLIKKCSEQLVMLMEDLKRGDINTSAFEKKARSVYQRLKSWSTPDESADTPNNSEPDKNQKTAAVHDVVTQTTETAVVSLATNAEQANIESDRLLFESVDITQVVAVPQPLSPIPELHEKLVKGPPKSQRISDESSANSDLRIDPAKDACQNRKTITDEQIAERRKLKKMLKEILRKKLIEENQNA